MKKLLILLLIILLTPKIGFSEELYPRGTGKSETKETHPIYFGYMEDYAKELRKAFENKRMFALCHWGTEYDFTVTRDGKIKDMRVSVYQNDYFDQKVKEIIMSVKPLPFREGMNLPYMRFSVYLGYENYEDIHFSRGAAPRSPDNCFMIDVALKKYLWVLTGIRSLAKATAF